MFPYKPGCAPLIHSVTHKSYVIITRLHLCLCYVMDLTFCFLFVFHATDQTLYRRAEPWFLLIYFLYVWKYMLIAPNHNLQACLIVSAGYFSWCYPVRLGIFLRSYWKKESTEGDSSLFRVSHVRFATLHCTIEKCLCQSSQATIWESSLTSSTQW